MSGVQSPEPPRIFGLTLEEVLAQALDSAHAVGDPNHRAAQVEQVGDAALRHGLTDLARDVLIDLPDPVARALMHLRLCDIALEEGDPTQMRHHLDRALGDVRSATRWSPRSGWLTSDAARAELTARLADLGDLDAAEQLAGEISRDRTARGRALVAVAGARLAEGEPAATRAWQRAVAAAREVEDPGDLRSVLTLLCARAARAGAGGRVADLVREVVVGGWRLDRPHRQLIAESAAAALHRAGQVEAADWTWERAIELALSGDDYGAATALCRIAEQRRALEGDDAGRQVVRAALDLVQDAPLPPGPDDRYPWQPIHRTALRVPALGGPLLEVLKSRRTLAPAWCYVLGQLHIAAGESDRACRAAAVLEGAHAMDTSDLEPLWMAALLYCQARAIDPALVAMRRVLAELDPGTEVELPGDEGGPRLVESHFAHALLDAGAVGPALDMARLSPEGEQRGALLHLAARVCVADGEVERAIDLCHEAASTLAGSEPSAPRSARSLGALPGEIARMLWAFGEHDAALGVVRAALDGIAGLSRPLGMNLACELEARLAPARADPMMELLAGTCGRQVRDAADPAERCELLLVMADAGFPVVEEEDEHGAGTAWGG